MIMGIVGPEGAGKTCLMTSFCVAHHRLGGKVLAFPGYKVNYEGKTISETLYPDQWVNLPEFLSQGILIAITEADSWFDSLDFQSTMAKMFRNLGKQRRKRNIGIIYDLQEIEWFNKRLRALTHILMSCWDTYWSTRLSDSPTPRGTRIRVIPQDLKGFYTGQPGSYGKPFYFNAQLYWDNYDTGEITDVFDAMTKVNIKKREITIKDGQVVPEDASAVPNMDVSSVERFAEQMFRPEHDGVIKQVVEQLRSRNVKEMPAEALRQLIASQGVSMSSVSLGKYLRKLGVIYHSSYRNQEAKYVIP